MLQTRMGFNYLGEWTQRNAACDARENESSAAFTSNDTKVRHILETRWTAHGRPSEGYVWPAPTKTGRICEFRKF